MKTAIMSDAHANPFALEAAIHDAEALGCGRWVFLGDLTGYGPDADQALKLVRERFDVAVMGNHDVIAADLDHSVESRMIPNYDLDRLQGSRLDEESREWLAGRPFEHREGECAYTHGTFVRPMSFDYMHDTHDARCSLMERDERFLFVGHTHWPCVMAMDEKGRMAHVEPRDVRVKETTNMLTVHVHPGCRYVVNGGSVGHPRAFENCTYAIFDDVGAITIRGLPFDRERYVAELAAAGIEVPHWLASA